MKKINRFITENQLEKSKNNNTQNVMNNIENVAKASFLNKFNFKLKHTFILTTLLLIILAVVLVNLDDDSNLNNLDNNIVLNDSTTETLAELSYMSGSLLSESFTLSNEVYLQLDKPVKNTYIETNIEELNSYFDMLKVFLEEEPFENAITTEVLVDEEYQNKISFSSDDKSYEFFINIVEEKIDGVLYIEEIMYIVEGKQTMEETESKLQLKAVSGSDFVEVTYISNSEELETTQKYKVETSINGIVSEKSIKVTIEDGSYKVTIEDLTSKYNLKKNTEDDQGKYKLDYTIEGEKGRANIYEELDENNNLVYRYEVREGNLTDSIIVPAPEIITEEQSAPLEEKKEKNYTI